MQIPLATGDYVLQGRFKNQRQKVKSLGTDDLGQPTYNKGKKLLAVRIEKTMPLDKQSGKTKRERKEMDKVAFPISRLWTPFMRSQRATQKTSLLKGALSKARGKESVLAQEGAAISKGVQKYQDPGLGESVFGNVFNSRNRRLNRLQSAKIDKSIFDQGAAKRSGAIQGKIKKYEARVGQDEAVGRVKDRAVSIGNTVARAGIVGAGGLTAASMYSKSKQNQRGLYSQGLYR